MQLGSVSSLQVSPYPVSSLQGQYRIQSSPVAGASAYAAPSAVGAYYNASLMAARTQASQPHFGTCICPICASMAIIVEAHNKIKKMQSGEGILPGATMQAITAKTGFNYIPHERATRLDFPAVSDVENLEKGAMDKIDAANGQVKLEIPPEGSLYSTLSAALMMANPKPESYHAHRNDILYSPSSQAVVQQTLGTMEEGQYKVMSILHHMQNADDRITKPISLGYMMTGSLAPASKELAVMSIRPLPTMENMDAAPAGLSNLLVNLAFDPKKRFDTFAVAVEPNQLDVKRHLEAFKELGIGVKRYAKLGESENPNGMAVTDMPKAYETELMKLYPKSQPALYQVSVADIRNWTETSLPEAARSVLQKSNPDGLKAYDDLMKKSKKPSEEALLNVLVPAPPPGSRKPIPREEELEADHHAHQH